MVSREGPGSGLPIALELDISTLRPLASGNVCLTKNPWTLSSFSSVPGGLRGHLHRTIITNKNLRLPAKTRLLHSFPSLPDPPSRSPSIQIFSKVCFTFTEVWLTFDFQLASSQGPSWWVLQEPRSGCLDLTCL